MPGGQGEEFQGLEDVQLELVRAAVVVMIRSFQMAAGLVGFKLVDWLDAGDHGVRPKEELHHRGVGGRNVE